MIAGHFTNTVTDIVFRSSKSYSNSKITDLNSTGSMYSSEFFKSLNSFYKLSKCPFLIDKTFHEITDINTTYKKSKLTRMISDNLTVYTITTSKYSGSTSSYYTTYYTYKNITNRTISFIYSDRRKESTYAATYQSISVLTIYKNAKSTILMANTIISDKLKKYLSYYGLQHFGFSMTGFYYQTRTSQSANDSTYSTKYNLYTYCTISSNSIYFRTDRYGQNTSVIYLNKNSTSNTTFRIPIDS